jgi:transcriptional regulator with XRE-family HTH domain
MLDSKRSRRYDSTAVVSRLTHSIDAKHKQVKRNVEINLRACRVSSYGDKLKDLRSKAGLDQEDVPEALKRFGIAVSLRSYQGYEQSENEPRSTRKKDAIVRALERLAAERDPSVEKRQVLTGAAIIIRHADTNEIWVTAELAFNITVHEPVSFVSSKGGGGNEGAGG